MDEEKKKSIMEREEKFPVGADSMVYSLYRTIYLKFLSFTKIHLLSLFSEHF